MLRIADFCKFLYLLARVILCSGVCAAILFSAPHKLQCSIVCLQLSAPLRKSCAVQVVRGVKVARCRASCPFVEPVSCWLGAVSKSNSFVRMSVLMTVYAAWCCTFIGLTLYLSFCNSSYFHCRKFDVCQTKHYTPRTNVIRVSCSSDECFSGVSVVHDNKDNDEYR